MRSTIKKLSKNEFIQGGLLLTVSYNIVNVLNYLFNVFAARALGPQGLGELTAFMSYIVIVSAPSLVISTIIIQKIGAAKNKETYAVALQRWFDQKMIRWLPIVGLCVLLSPLVPRVTNLSFYTGLLVIPMILLTLYGSFPDAIIQGLRLFVVLSVISTIAIILKVSGAAISLWIGGGLQIILLFLVLCTLFKIIANIHYIYRIKTRINEAALPIDKRLIEILKKREFLFTAATIIAVTLYNNIDVVYAKKFLSAHDAGIYSSWSLLAKIIFYLAGPLFSISLIFFSSKDQEKKHITTFAATMILIILLGVASFIGYTFLGSIIVPLFFGSRFNEVIPILSKASIFGSLYLAVTFINQYFLARKILYALIIALVIPVYVVLLIVLLPTLSGLIDLNNTVLFFTVALYILAALKEQYFDKKPMTF